MFCHLRKSRWLVFCFAVFVTELWLTVAVAQEKAPRADDAGDKSAEKKSGPKAKGPFTSPAMPAFTPAREAAAMAFVREHHPEVADLLENLRSSRPEQYRRAARELFRASERVSQWKERDAARYELELAAWKINSRIQLLLARSSMSPDVDVEEELKKLITERVETRLAIRKLDREQLSKRLALAEADIERLSKEKDATVERQLKQMQQNIKANRQRVRPGGKNARKPAASEKDKAEKENSDEPKTEKKRATDGK